MKYMIYIILTLGMYAVSALPTDWAFSKKVKKTSMWKLKSHPEVRGVYFSENSLPQTNWEQVKLEDFKKWARIRQQFVKERVGIQDWKVSDYNWRQNTDNEYLLSLKGSYVGKDNTKIYFIEEHVYHNGQTLQILVTSPKSKFVRKTASINQLVNHARSELL